MVNAIAQRFNRDIVECKFVIRCEREQVPVGFNRDIVECK